MPKENAAQAAKEDGPKNTCDWVAKACEPNLKQHHAFPLHSVRTERQVSLEEPRAHGTYVGCSLHWPESSCTEWEPPCGERCDECEEGERVKDAPKIQQEKQSSRPNGGLPVLRTSLSVHAPSVVDSLFRSVEEGIRRGGSECIASHSDHRLLLRS